MTRYTAPRPIRDADATEQFACGEPALDQWLRRRAKANELGRASRTFVTCPDAEPGTVVGYYTLAAGSVRPAAVPGRVRRNMPDPIPVAVLGRLAVDQAHQGAGLGSSLLLDAIPRVVAAGAQIGIRALVIHALSPAAAAFYTKLGFTPATPGALTMVATVADLAKTLDSLHPQSW